MVEFLRKAEYRTIVVTAVAMAVVSAVLMVGDAQMGMVVGLVSAATLGIGVSLPTPTGRRYNLSTAVGVAAAPLLMIGDTSLRLRPSVTVVILASVAAHIVVVALGADAKKSALTTVRYIVLGALTFVVYGAVAQFAWRYVAPDRAQLGLIAAGSASLALFAAHTLLPAADTRIADGLRRHVANHLPEWPVAVTLLASGAFFGVVWQEMTWWWAAAVAVVPYLFAHVGFTLSERTGGSYLATIEALSRVPEVAGLTPDGHAIRTAALALDIAAEVRVPLVERTELHQAALLHDIGRLTLSHPTILRQGFTDEDVARWGAEMIREAPPLLRVADIVAHQHEPYRRPGEHYDPDLPMASKIIRVASAFDHATTDLGYLPLEALEELHRGAAYDFDPDVVAATRTVLSRNGTI